MTWSKLGKSVHPKGESAWVRPLRRGHSSPERACVGLGQGGALLLKPVSEQEGYRLYILPANNNIQKDFLKVRFCL